MNKIKKLVQALLPYQPEKIRLIGSWARGEQDELSDIDVIVIKTTTVPFLSRLTEVAKLLPPDLGAVDVLVYTPEEYRQMLQDGNSFARTAEEEGKELYARAV